MHLSGSQLWQVAILLDTLAVSQWGMFLTWPLLGRPGGAVKDEPKQELAVNGEAEPLEAADGLTDEERARLKAEKKAAKKEKKVRCYYPSLLDALFRQASSRTWLAARFLPSRLP